MKIKRIKKYAFKNLYILRREIRTLVWSIITKLYKTWTIKTKQGIFKVLTKDLVISKQLFTTKGYEYDFTERFIEFLEDKKAISKETSGTLIDIGANIGTTTIFLMKENLFEKALSIEPDPQNNKLLKENIKLNQLQDKVISLQAAATDKDNTELIFELSDTNFGDHRVSTDKFTEKVEEKFNESQRERIVVKGMRLDSLIEENSLSPEDVSLVWIDVQGHEPFVIQGAKELFRSGVPVITEIWPYGIRRSGSSKEEFCSVVSEIWTHFYIFRRNNFVRYPIEMISYLFDEMPGKEDYDNVIFAGALSEWNN